MVHHKRKLCGVFLFIAGLSCAQALQAEHSNRNEVRANLGSDGWYVVWGHNFTEGDWIEGGISAAASIVAEDPAIFIEWLEYKWDQNWQKMRNNLPGVLEQTVKDLVVQSIRDQQIKQIAGLKIQAGFATYNRWEEIVYHEPETYTCRQSYRYPCPTIRNPFRMCDGWTDSICSRMVEKRRTVTLPNWHQFYVRYKLVSNGGGGSTNPGVGGSGRLVSLKTGGGHYVVAEGNGGGQVNANRTAIGDWEKFYIIPLSGGALQSGDKVNLKTQNGHYFCAEGAGGGDLNANRVEPSVWEEFTVVKLNGGGQINNGDLIALKTQNGHYIVAEGNGGGDANANRTAIGAWETFTIIFH